MDTLFEDDVHAKELIDLSRKVHQENEALQAEISRLRVALCQSDALNAWAAGLFEGEGSVRCDRTCVRIALTMCDEDVVRRWGQAVGAGKLYGPYPPRGTGTKPQWQWTVQKLVDVEAVYIRLYPWLGSRRMQQFDDAMAKYRAARQPTASPTAPGGQEEG